MEMHWLRVNVTCTGYVLMSLVLANFHASDVTWCSHKKITGYFLLLGLSINIHL